MAHYCILNDNNEVIDAFPGVDETETIEGLSPEEWYGKFHGHKCLRYSFNTRGGIHVSGGTPFRKNPGGIGFFYDSIRDAFIPPKPYPSWLLDEDTCQWEAPIEYPSDGKFYTWNESSQNWEEVQ